MFSCERTLQDEGQKLGLSTLTRFHVSVFLWAKTWQDISARTDVFAASSLIHIKTVENDKIRWTWNSAYVRAVTAVNLFHHPSKKPSFSLAHIKTEGFKNDVYSKDPTQVTVFESLCFHQRFWAF